MSNLEHSLNAEGWRGQVQGELSRMYAYISKLNIDVVHRKRSVLAYYIRYPISYF
jgi:hypothetical protein